jgi:hypothetical protein
VSAIAAALVVWIVPRLPSVPSASDCGAATPLAFCATLPPFRSPDPAAARMIDQARPCETGSAAPSFCLALPKGAPADPTVLIAKRQDACAQLAPGEAPGFCLAPPSQGSVSSHLLEREVAFALLRQRLGPEFRRAGTGTVELWTETSMSAAVADRIFAGLVVDAAAVQAAIGRPFGDPPGVLLFTSRASFASALERQFGFPAATAALLSRQTGGLTLAGIDAVAINAENVLTSGRPTIFRHELTHVAVHRLSGDSVPAWLDEGLATVAEDLDPYGAERAATLSLLASGAAASVAFDEARSWLDRNTALDGHAYGIAAEATRAIAERTGMAALTSALDRMGAGTAPAKALADLLGEPVERFVAALPDRALAGCRQGILLSAARPDGLRIWRAYGFRPNAALTVTVDGPGHYAFNVTADRSGVNTGTVGTPMPSGPYVLRVAADSGESAQVALTLGDAAASASRGCTVR